MVNGHWSRAERLLGDKPARRFSSARRRSASAREARFSTKVVSTPVVHHSQLQIFRLRLALRALGSPRRRIPAPPARGSINHTIRSQICNWQTRTFVLVSYGRDFERLFVRAFIRMMISSAGRRGIPEK